jgi:hypothetical protein
LQRLCMFFYHRFQMKSFKTIFWRFSKTPCIRNIHKRTAPTTSIHHLFLKQPGAQKSNPSFQNMSWKGL